MTILLIALGFVLGDFLNTLIKHTAQHFYLKWYTYFLKRKMNVHKMSDEEIFAAARELLNNFDSTTMAPDEPTVRYKICSSCKKFKKNFTEGRKPKCFDCEYGESDGRE